MVTGDVVFQPEVEVALSSLEITGTRLCQVLRNSFRFRLRSLGRGDSLDAGRGVSELSTHSLLHTHHSTMSLQHFGKATLRVAKNYTKGYSDVQTKVRDATSNDPWGPTGQQMNEIAQMTYNQCVFQLCLT